MAVIKQSSSRAAANVGGVVHLGDLRVAAQHALDEARREAASIVEAARAECDRMRAEARRDGFEEGRAAGLSQGLEEGGAKGLVEGRAAAQAAHAARLAAVEESFAAELSRWMARRDEVMRGAERELAGIALAIAESIVREHIDANRDAVAHAAEAAVGLFARATRVTVEVAAEDVELVAEAMPRLTAALPEGAAVSIRPSTAVGRGGCIVRSPEGTVDARIETQFRRMREGLIGRASDPDRGTSEADEPLVADADADADGTGTGTDATGPEAGDAGGRSDAS